MDDSVGSEAVDSFSFHGNVGVKKALVDKPPYHGDSDSDECGEEAGDVNDLLDDVLDPNTEVPAEQKEEPYEVVIRPKERTVPVERPQSESGVQV